VSLSLAASAIGGTAASAKTAMTSARISETANKCAAFKNGSKSASGLSPLAVALAHEGLKAMWITFVTKCTAIATATLVAAGLVWAAQQGGGNAPVGDQNKSRVQVELLAANDQAETGKAARTSGEKNGGNGQAAELIGGRFKYKVPIETGSSEFKEGAQLKIEEIWGTRPRIEVGGQYMVRGKYVLPRGEKGKLHFYETATGNWGREPTAHMDLQTIELDKETGEFTLVHGMQGPGHFHLYLASPDQYSRYFANVYFGTGDNVLRKKTWGTPSDAAEAAKPSPPADNSTAKAASAEYRLQPFDAILIRTKGLPVDEALNDAYYVEDMGTLALGPTFGRVKVAGLTILEAEEVIRSKLSEVVNPKSLRVQASVASRKADVLPGPQVAPTGTFQPAAKSAIEFDHSPASKGDLANVAHDVENLKQMVAREYVENAELKKQLMQSKNSSSETSGPTRIVRPGDQVAIVRYDKKTGKKSVELVVVGKDNILTEVAGMKRRDAEDKIRESMERTHPGEGIEVNVLERLGERQQ
jgi:protein involved in polysaccharide export with SLBB domain